MGDGRGLNTAQGAAVCRRNPACLLAPADIVAAVVEAVQKQLGSPQEGAAQLCIRNLRMLQRSLASIAANTQARKQHGFEGADLGGCMVRQHYRRSTNSFADFAHPNVLAVWHSLCIRRYAPIHETDEFAYE
jgi:hypothetical protein